MATVYSFSVETPTGVQQSLQEYAGKVLLIVNTASKCGFTPQYKGLQELHEATQSRGFTVLAFPCNQFGHQEPGTIEEVLAFCQMNYRVTFPVFAKIDVNGPNAHPLYQYLTRSAKGVLGSEAIKWNFTKFLVDRQGNVVKRYASATTPESLRSDIETLLVANGAELR
ncbi:glutathione peroxidase [Alicyclobacillaceae bacterium I2511]|nr:glutathione peroxidase [Alicyclobacillaceae bacterium I2511]